MPAEAGGVLPQQNVKTSKSFFIIRKRERDRERINGMLPLAVD
jgi:hypothetical protein